MKKQRVELGRWLLQGLALVLVLLVLAGCQQAVHKTVFTKSGGGETTTLAFYTKGHSDRVSKQVTTLVIDLPQIMASHSAAVLTSGWKIVRDDARAHAQLRGVKARASRHGNTVREVITVDTGQVNFAKLASLDDQTLPGKTDHIGLANEKRTLKADGYREVKAEEK